MIITYLGKYSSGDLVSVCRGPLWDTCSFLFCLLVSVVRIHNSACLHLLYSGIITLFLILTLGSAKGRLGAFWHLWGVNSSLREAVWLSHNPRPPRPRAQHSPNHSDSQMAALPAASNHAFQLLLRLGWAIAQLSAFGDTWDKGGAGEGWEAEKFLHPKKLGRPRDQSPVYQQCAVARQSGGDSQRGSSWCGSLLWSQAEAGDKSLSIIVAFEARSWSGEGRRDGPKHSPLTFVACVKEREGREGRQGEPLAFP